MMNSNRKFKITHFDREDVKEFTVTFRDLIGAVKDSDFFETEMQFSLDEQLDELLDLKLWERMSFLEDRNDPNSLSIIISIQ